MLEQGLIFNVHGSYQFGDSNNAANNPHDGNTLRAPSTPAWLSPQDDRQLRDVFGAPHITFADPNLVHWHPNNQGGNMIPVHPGAPVTTGLRQVVYDGQACWDRSKVDMCGPVRSFFRAMMGKKTEIVQS
jgi:hypothetical protein